MSEALLTYKYIMDWMTLAVLHMLEIASLTLELIIATLKWLAKIA